MPLDDMKELLGNRHILNEETNNHTHDKFESLWEEFLVDFDCKGQDTISFT
jgi:hypothetical protein